MPYPFVVGETLGAVELNAALDMRMMASGAGLAFTPGAILFGATAGGFQTDATNLFWDDTNNRLGINANAPQAMLQVGRNVAASARTYNSYVDTANGAWAYLGDWTKTSGVAVYGSDKNGSGVVADVSFVRGGTEQLRLTANGVTMSAGSITQAQPLPVLFSGSVTLSGAISRGVAVVGNYAYVTSSGVTPTHTLEIFDITIPTAPAKIGGLDLVGGALGKPVVAGQILYTGISQNTTGLQIVDVSNPKAPSLLRSVATIAIANVTLSGNYLYAILSAGGTLRIWDVSDPTNPILKSTTTLPGISAGMSIWLQGKYAFIAGTQTVAAVGGLAVVDISDPVTPVVVSTSYNAGSSPRGLIAAGKYLYLSNVTAATGFEVVDISDPAAPVLVKSLATVGAGAGYVNPIIAGKYLYHLNGIANGIQIFDISDPANPTSLGVSPTTASVTGAVLSGNRLYIAANAQFRIYDTFGIDSPTIKAGSLNADRIYVDGQSYFDGDMYAQRGLVVGAAGIFSRGPIVTDASDAAVPISASFGAGLVCFGGMGLTFPALKRSGAILQTRLGDDSNYAGMEAANLTVGGFPIVTAGTLFEANATSTSVYAATTSSVGPRISIINSDSTTNNNFARICFNSYNSTPAAVSMGAITCVFTEHLVGSEATAITFQGRLAGTYGERGRIAGNNWGVGGNFATNAPQAMLHVGTTTATARSYQAYTDAANGSWAYMGDWSKTAFVATYGTDQNGTGVVRAVNIMAAGVNAISIDTAANVSIQKFLGLNGATALVPFYLSGSFTTALQIALASIDATLISAATGSQYGFIIQPKFQPSGASLSFCAGLVGDLIIGGSVAITEAVGIYASAVDITTYTGANLTYAEAIAIEGPAGMTATKWVSTYTGLWITGTTNGNATTTGTIFNLGVNFQGGTAGPAAGGTIHNRGINVLLPTGGGAGTTVNMGLCLSGNGGAGGTTTNYSLYSDSTALSLIASLRVGVAGGTANPTNATAPFLYVTASAGVPTGVPRDAAAGSIAVQWDSTNKKLMVYDQPTATWKGVVLA